MKLANIDKSWYYSEDFTDKATYDNLRKGYTTEVFQMGSYSATSMLQNFKADNIDIISIVNAGNRPGPLSKNPNTGKSMVDLFKERRECGIIPSIDHRIDGILKETMGCIWYQEQCLLLSQVMAGYTLGGSDIQVRKTLCKKKVSKIPEIRNEFIYGKQSIWDDEHKNVTGISNEPSKYCKGAIANGFSEDIAKKVFSDMENFAKYSFNKAHSFCYGVLGFKSAWALTHYPCEYSIAAMMSIDDQDKINAVLRQAKKLGVQVLPPDILHSDVSFSMEYVNNVKCIRYGLVAIKYVGIEAIEYIKEVRKNYVINNFEQFYNTIKDKNVVDTYSKKITSSGNKTCPANKTCINALISAGAFDCLEKNRYKLLNLYNRDILKDKKYEELNESAYCKKYKLKLEQDTMGTYVSEHPLDNFPYMSLKAVANNANVETTGIVKSVTIKTSPRGGTFANVLLEDKEGCNIRAMFFGSTYTQNSKKLKKNEILIITGTFNSKFSNINVTKCKRLTKKGDCIRLPDEEDGIVDLTQQQAPKVLEMPVVDYDNGSVF